jgi:hypothetical protein
MPRHQRKAIMLFADSPFGDYSPAVCVKAPLACFNNGKGFPSVEDVVARFHCSEETAEKALEYVFESHAALFWEHAERIANDILGKVFTDRRLAVYQEGRSGGWLIVQYEPINHLHGNCNALPRIDEWDARQVAAWGRFEKAIGEAVDGYCDSASVFETIEANEWALDADSLETRIEEALS